MESQTLPAFPTRHELLPQLSSLDVNDSNQLWIRFGLTEKYEQSMNLDFSFSNFANTL